MIIVYVVKLLLCLPVYYVKSYRMEFKIPIHKRKIISSH